MEAVRITEEERTLIGHLSKGYRQRVGLAQALIHDPDVLILDEPTVGLDPRQMREVRDLIRGLAGEHTVILSTHILSEASQICHRMLIINEGHIVAEDTPAHLTATLKGNDRLFLRLQSPPPEAAVELQRLPGVLAVDAGQDGGYDLTCAAGEEHRPEIAAWVAGRGWGLLEMRPVVMGLEDIFLKLTQSEPEEEEASDA